MSWGKSTDTARLLILVNCLNMSFSSECSWPTRTSECRGCPRSVVVISDRVDVFRHWASVPTLATPMHTLSSLNAVSRHILDTSILVPVHCKTLSKVHVWCYVWYINLCFLSALIYLKYTICQRTWKHNVICGRSHQPIWSCQQHDSQHWATAPLLLQDHCMKQPHTWSTCNLFILVLHRWPLKRTYDTYNSVHRAPTNSLCTLRYNHSPRLRCRSRR